MKKGIIIGAGIGGLTTAIALAKKGIYVDIYDKAQEIKEVGAGVWIAPNGMKIFDKLGLSQEIVCTGKELNQISVVDLNYKPISVINADEIQLTHGFKTVAIHRAKLQQKLLSKVDPQVIHLNKEFSRYEQNENRVLVNFTDGTSVEADFLICADGLKSKGREQMVGKFKLRDSGQTCWRFTTVFNLPNQIEDDMFEVWADSKGLRVGYSKIDDQHVYVYITNSKKTVTTEKIENTKNHLLEICKPFSKIVNELIQTVDEDQIIRTDLYDFKPIPKWTNGRVVLIGDAAHATTPNLGQGACQAIEDAWVLASELSKDDLVEEALIRFQQKRFEKAKFITSTSWFFSQLTNTSGLMKSIVKFALRATPEFMNKKQLDRIYTVD